MELSAGKPAKPGIKIQKPIDIKIHPIYILMAVISFIAIGFTVWLLVYEYLGMPTPAWLRSLLEDFVLTL